MVNSSLLLKTLPHVWHVNLLGVWLIIGGGIGGCPGGSGGTSGGGGTISSLTGSLGFLSYGKSGSLKILHQATGLCGFHKHL